MINNFGGCEINTISSALDGKIIFANGPYFYAQYEILAETIWIPPVLGSMTVFVKSIPTGYLSISTTDEKLTEGDALQVEQSDIELSVVNGTKATILVAGTKECFGSQGAKLTSFQNLKKISKPWGHELWINNQHAGYALKEIFIRAPYRTSLQYHRQKEETNVLFHGSIYLHYKNNDTLPNEQVTQSDVSVVKLEPLSIISIRPPVLHRVEALSDVLLYEVSTPHLDDVIRISDDTLRPDGRIESEHNTNA